MDAHVCVNRGVGLGVSVRDWNGGFLAVAVTRLNVLWDARMAEATTTRYGVIIARRLGYERVCLESDALTFTTAIAHEHRGFAPIFLLLYDINYLSQSFCFFSLQ